MIPKSFRLMGHVIEVVIVPKKYWKNRKFEGHWNPGTCTISVIDGLSPQRTQQVFCHELTHAMLDYLNNPMSKDEAFVDTFGALLQQVWSSIDEN